MWLKIDVRERDAVFGHGRRDPICSRADELGDRFVAAFNEVKNLEYDAYQQIISSWERENPLLNV
jgi:glutamine synthetase